MNMPGMCFSPPQGSTKVRMPPLPFYGKCVIPFPFRPISTRMGRLMSTHAGSKRSDLRTSDDKSPRSAPFRHVAPRSTTPKVSSALTQRRVPPMTPILLGVTAQDVALGQA